MALSIDPCGQVAIVTGASSGIGAGIARALAGAGAYVGLVGRDETRLGAVLDDIVGEDGSGHAIARHLRAPEAPEAVGRERARPVRAHGRRAPAPARRRRRDRHLLGGGPRRRTACERVLGNEGRAVEMMAWGLAIDQAPNGVRVNAIAPGNIDTPMNEHLLADPEYRATKIEATPLRRIGVVTDITGTVVLLASRHSGFTTGTSISIDGGHTAG